MPTLHRPWRLVLPFIVVSALGLVWSAYWLHALGRVQEEVAVHEAKLAERGGAFACGERRWSGYPLRISLSCRRTALTLAGGAMIEAAGFTAAVPAYDLGTVATVAEGPTRLRFKSDGETVAIDHRPLVASFATSRSGEREVSLIAEEIILADAAGWALGGRNISLSGRLSVASPPATLAVAAKGRDLTVGGRRLASIAIDEFEVAARIEEVPAIVSSDPGTLLREAIRRGLRITVDRLSARIADIRLGASGTVELSPDGHPNGTLATTVSNLKGFLDGLEQRGLISRKAARASLMMIGLLQGGAKRPEGEARVNLRFHNGRVLWGPFVLAELPPLR